MNVENPLQEGQVSKKGVMDNQNHFLMELERTDMQ